MCVLRILQNVSLLAASLIRFGNLFHSLGADDRKDFPPYTQILRSQQPHSYMFLN